jgi:hypothetical protein
MTMQELLVYILRPYAVNLDQTPVTIGLVLAQSRDQVLWIHQHAAGIEVGLYEQGTGEYTGTRLPLFELTLTSDLDGWHPTEISWTHAFLNDQGVPVDHDWFVQHCASYL